MNSKKLTKSELETMRKVFKSRTVKTLLKTLKDKK